MRNLLKSTLALFIIGSLALPVQANAITAKPKKERTAATQELIRKFPKFEQSLNEHTTGELVERSENYIKFTPKKNKQIKEVYTTDTITEDFDVSYHSKEEYLQESQLSNLSSGLITTLGIGEFEPEPCSWLKVDLEVYYSESYNYHYMAYNFCSWLTNPSIKLTDGIGISVSDGLIMSGGPDTRYAEYNFIVPDLGIERHKPLTVTVNSYANGVVASNNLDSTTIPSHITYPIREYHEWMIQTGIAYNSPSVNRGRITGHYLHKEIGFGSIGMDASGTPNVGLSARAVKTKGGIEVSR